MKRSLVLVAVCVLASSAAYAAAAKSEQGSPLLPGGNSKAPVSIEADKLVYYDKEQKAVYSGNVVIIQGDTKLTCSTMTIYHGKVGAATANSQPAKPADASGTARFHGRNRAACGIWIAGSGHRSVENANRDRRQRRLRQAAEQSLAHRPCHVE